MLDTEWKALGPIKVGNRFRGLVERVVIGVLLPEGNATIRQTVDCHYRAWPTLIRNGAMYSVGTHLSEDAAVKCAERTARRLNKQAN